jgi:hypothetical protein
MLTWSPHFLMRVKSVHRCALIPPVKSQLLGLRDAHFWLMVPISVLPKAEVSRITRSHGNSEPDRALAVPWPMVLSHNVIDVVPGASA